MPSSSVLRIASALVIALPLLALGGGCGKGKPDVAVNAAYEMLPPIASEVAITQLQGGAKGRVRVEADFGRGTLKGPFHAVQLADEKVVLRDDGRDGDRSAGDGVFTVTLEEDMDAVKAELQESAKQAVERPVFAGRELVSAARRDTALDLEAFLNGVRVPFARDFFCRLFLDVSIPHSLMVIDPAVVDDPTRTSNRCSATPSATAAWSFAKLVTDMANTPLTGVSPEDLVRDWLDSWLSVQTVNSDPIPARTPIFNSLIKPWLVSSGTPAANVTPANWKTLPINLAIAPFKLIAIVNRVDLRGNSGYGFANPGEGRFVFEALSGSSCVPLGPGFTVIFEYGLPIHDCKALQSYARQWYDLKNLTLGSVQYNQALQALTEVFAKVNADPSRPNGSSLNQIRTNERVFGSPWELREFNLDPATHKLFTTTVKQEPAKIYNAQAAPPGTAPNVTLMADWVNANATDVIADRHTIPLNLSPGGQPFLGGKSHTEFGGFWDAAPAQITDDEARFHLSLNTCSGCHGGETATTFLHVGLANPGTPAPLSGFLTGVTVADPAGRPTPATPKQRTFNDLQRRQASTEELLCMQCNRRLFDLIHILRFKPVHMPH